MFYSKYMFVTKGRLAKVWLAAHWEKKLTKQGVLKTDVEESCETIINPMHPLALRVSGQLLVGVSRIYQRKVKYLQEDASDAMTKIKMTFRPSNVDLPPDATVAAEGAITMRQEVPMDDWELPDIPLADLARLDDPDLDHSLMLDLEMPVGRDGATLQHDGDIEPSTLEMELDIDGEVSMKLEEEAAQEDLLGITDASLMMDSHTATGDHPDVSMDIIPMDDMDITMDLGLGEIGVETDIPATPGFGNQSAPGSEIEQGRDAALSDMDPSMQLSAAELNLHDKTGPDGLVVEEDQESMLKLQDVQSPSMSGIGIDASNLQSPGFNLADHSIMPMDIQSPMVQQPKRKKQRVYKIDNEIELSSRHIKNSIKDVSDITGHRPKFNFKRKRRYRRANTTTTKASFEEGLKRFPARRHRRMAPELQEMFAAMVQQRVIDQQDSDDEQPAEQEQDKNKDEDDQKHDETIEIPDISLADQQLPADLDETLDLEGMPQAEGPGLEQEFDMNLEDVDLADIQLDPIEEPQEEEGPQMNEEIFDKPSNLDVGIARGGKGSWSKRTEKMFQWLDNNFQDQDEISYEAMVKGKKRRTAVGCFYELLVLKSHDFIQVEQPEAHGDIAISKTDKWDDVPDRNQQE